MFNYIITYRARRNDISAVALAHRLAGHADVGAAYGNIII